MKGFIEVTSLVSGAKMLISTNEIVEISDYDDGAYITLKPYIISDRKKFKRGGLTVKESFSEVLKKLEEAL